MICKFRFLGWIVFSLLAMASSASVPSAGSSIISKYISKVRADLRRQRPETRESWLRAEMNSMNYKTSHQGKPSVRNICRYLNLEVSHKQIWLKREILVQDLVETLISEIRHEVDSASASAGSSGVCSKYRSQVRAELRRQHPETRESWLRAEMDSMHYKISHLIAANI